MADVCISGIGVITPYGEGINCMMDNIIQYKTITKPYYEEPGKYSKMNTYLLTALNEARITVDEEHIRNAIVIIATTVGTALTAEKLYSKFFQQGNTKGFPCSKQLQMMHSCLSSTVRNHIGSTNRSMDISAACAGGLQAIILGYEMIKNGIADTVVCGGVEEKHPITDELMKKLFISSPTISQPFTEDRTGVYLTEGAGVIILQKKELANVIYGIIEGVGINSSLSMTTSCKESIVDCMRQTGIRRYDSHILVSAHATGTMVGDTNEAKAISEVTPFTHVIALKGYLGHTAAASGPIELAASLYALNHGIVLGSGLPLDEYVYEDYPLRFSREHQKMHTTNMFLLKNSLGLGGQNTSILVSPNYLKE